MIRLKWGEELSSKRARTSILATCKMCGGEYAKRPNSSYCLSCRFKAMDINHKKSLEKLNSGKYNKKDNGNRV